jgi:hypothetical protein
MSQTDKDCIKNANLKTEYLVAHLLDFFRDPRHEIKFGHAAKIALNYLCSSETKESLYRRFIFYANNLKGNLTPLSIRTFAEACSSYYFNNNKEINKKTFAEKSLKKKAQDELLFLLSCGHSQEAALQRTAQSLFKEKKRLIKQDNLKKLISNHPLRDFLIPHDVGQKVLPKEDIKGHFLRLNQSNGQGGKSSVLFGLLKKAQVFSTPRLHNLLGDDLFFLCRPLGFMEHNESVVIIEVPTNVHLHALTYRKLDIIRLLKEDPAFFALKAVRFKVRGDRV